MLYLKVLRMHSRLLSEDIHFKRNSTSQFSKERPLTVKMALEGSLKHTYGSFCAENPELKVSCSKFVELRPKNVLTISKTKSAFVNTV